MIPELDLAADYPKIAAWKEKLYAENEALKNIQKGLHDFIAARKAAGK